MQMKPWHVAAIGAVLMVGGSGAALAQRSFDAVFDSTRPIKLQGRVTLFEWTNPQSWIFIDVRDPRTGEHSSWKIEAGSPSQMLRNGWTKKTLPHGTAITVTAFRARDGSNRACAAYISVGGRHMPVGNAAAEAAFAAAAPRAEGQ